MDMQINLPISPNRHTDDLPTSHNFATVAAGHRRAHRLRPPFALANDWSPFLSLQHRQPVRALRKEERFR